jgi:metal-sulfur cluster biosynthetic enzyme
MALHNDMYTEEKLRQLLDEVIDPELGIGIYSLGLIYKTQIHFSDENERLPESTEITMTFTSPFCPYADAILEQVESAVVLGGFGTAKIILSFDPPWEAPEHLRTVLGL